MGCCIEGGSQFEWIHQVFVLQHITTNCTLNGGRHRSREPTSSNVAVHRRALNATMFCKRLHRAFLGQFDAGLEDHVLETLVSPQLSGLFFRGLNPFWKVHLALLVKNFHESVFHLVDNVYSLWKHPSHHN